MLASSRCGSEQLVVPSAGHSERFEFSVSAGVALALPAGGAVGLSEGAAWVSEGAVAVSGTAGETPPDSGVSANRVIFIGASVEKRGRMRWWVRQTAQIHLVHLSSQNISHKPNEQTLEQSTQREENCLCLTIYYHTVVITLFRR